MHGNDFGSLQGLIVLVLLRFHSHLYSNPIPILVVIHENPIPIGTPCTPLLMIPKLMFHVLAHLCQFAS